MSALSRYYYHRMNFIKIDEDRNSFLDNSISNELARKKPSLQFFHVSFPMSTTNSELIDFNKSAYVALSCLIAFAIVITVCILKQFVWDPLLAKRFESIRPVLSESVQRFSFLRSRSTIISSVSNQTSLVDICVKTNDPPSLLSNANILTVTQSLPFQRSYGSSSFSPYTYTNYSSDVFKDEENLIPILHFSCEFNPSTYRIKLTVQSLHHMSIFQYAIKSAASVIIRCRLFDQSHETPPQTYQDSIDFGDSFTILKHIHSGDLLDYRMTFFILLKIDEKIYEIAESSYSLKEDALTYVLFVERALPMQLKLVQSQPK